MLRRLAEAQHRDAMAAYDKHDETEQLRQTVADCGAKIGRYRAALDAGGDPALIGMDQGNDVDQETPRRPGLA